MDSNQKLQAAFQVECLEHLEGIRANLVRIEQHDIAAAGAVLEDAFRRAHSLKGAARITGAAEAEKLAHRLESLFSRVRGGDLQLNADVLSVIQMALDAIEDCTTRPANSGPPTDPGPILGELDRLTCVPPMQSPAVDDGQAGLTDRPSAASGDAMVLPVETVRLSAESLDRLLQSTGELLTESLKQDLVAHELSAMSRQIAGLDSHCKCLKKTTGTVRQLKTTSDLNRVRHGLDLIEHQIHSLFRQVRSVKLQQQRSAWSLRLLGEQLQRDVRQTRMVPAENVFQGFRKMVRDLARDEGKLIELLISGFELQADRMVLQTLKDPLMHILRNAVTHGIEPPDERRAQSKSPTGLVSLKMEAVGNRLTITVEDDGRGIDFVRTAEIAARRRLLSEEDAAKAEIHELSRLLFQPGFSTARVVTELSGRGIGLSVVQNAVARLQGNVELQPREGSGTIFSLTVPLAMSTHRLLLVSCQGQTFAIPHSGIESLVRKKPQELETVERKPMLAWEGQLIPVVLLDPLLGIENSDRAFETEMVSLVVLRCGQQRLAVVVDSLLAERDALIKNLPAPAAACNKFGGGMLLENGTVALVLSPAELLQASRSARQMSSVWRVKTADDAQPSTVLVVDDSFTTRTLETSILETHGYRVRVAVDGLEALNQLRSEKIDLVITDIQMPRLDGFGLLEEIKKDRSLAHIPVIVVSSVDRLEDQQRGLNLGADAYIVKRKFDHQDLLQTIQQIL